MQLRAESSKISEERSANDLYPNSHTHLVTTSETSLSPSPLPGYGS